MFQCWNSDMGTYKCMSAHFVRRHTIPHTSKDVLSFRLSHTSRCFKAIMFLTGFIFGSIVVYLICLEEGIFPLWANTVIAVSAGILFGLITLLVQYVGLFMLGKEKTSKTTFNNDQPRSAQRKGKGPLVRDSLKESELSERKIEKGHLSMSLGSHIRKLNPTMQCRCLKN